MNELQQARKAMRIYHKAMFLGDWFRVSSFSERRAIREVLRLIPEAVPFGCHGYIELEGERKR